MNYFKQFGLMDYIISGKQISVNDIFKSIQVKYHPAENITFYYTYDVKDGEKPEMIASKFYDDINLHWIVLMMNNIVDPYFDWLLSDRELLSATKSKYDDINAIHHFYHLIDKEIVDDFDTVSLRLLVSNNIPIPINISPVTNLQYESELNERKRSIKILQKKYIEVFVNEFETKMAGDK